MLSWNFHLDFMNYPGNVSPPSHGGNRGSNPLGSTNKSKGLALFGANPYSFTKHLRNEFARSPLLPQ